MQIKISGLYISALERCNETLGTRWIKEGWRHPEDPALIDVVLNDAIIFKIAGDSIKLDLGGKVEYISCDDFIEVIII